MADAALFPIEIDVLPPFEGSLDARQLSGSRCDVLFASYASGTRIAGHHHPTHNVGVVTAGALHLVVDGERSTYHAGQWYRVPAGVEHSASFEVDTALIELWFHEFDGEFDGRTGPSSRSRCRTSGW